MPAIRTTLTTMAMRTPTARRLRNRPLWLALLVVAAACLPIDAAAQHTYVPSGGYVADSATALRVAEAVLARDEAHDSADAPLRATLVDGVWSITSSSAPCDVLARIAQADGRVLDEAPADGFVPDAETAVRIAEAVLVPVYGQAQIDRQGPLTATEHDGVWTVTGRLPPGRAGGVALVRIARRDGTILRMIHGR